MGPTSSFPPPGSPGSVPPGHCQPGTCLGQMPGPPAGASSSWHSAHCLPCGWTRTPVLRVSGVPERGSALLRTGLGPGQREQQLEAAETPTPRLPLSTRTSLTPSWPTVAAGAPATACPSLLTRSLDIGAKAACKGTGPARAELALGPWGGGPHYWGDGSKAAEGTGGEGGHRTQLPGW